ncbi:MAG: NADH-quinone oxidoreductase subunit A [Bacteroidales bacterium]|nr:NADH-quinone oxidoreductase subunit A [Bacteroidales bacterium]HOK98013.1 NADH-quinone oxidoreductase subunit A [Bacteroidales bacterium]HPO65952.1 NADH-quinone oxidoreductase subunit A [Bacteroidales bacterium]
MGITSLLVLFLSGLGFAALAIGLNKILSYSRPNPIKAEPYECGVQTHGTTWVQFNVGYYLFSLVFLIFDVEIVFMYPWAVVFKQVGLVALIEIIFFIAILFFGLLYAYKKKALTWM